MNSNENITLLDVHKVCRTCLHEKDSMVNIFSSDISLKSTTTMIKVKDILKDVTVIKVNYNLITTFIYKLQKKNLNF